MYGSRVVLLVGSGDNGGDALYAGARLARRGAGVAPCCSRRTGRTRAASRPLRGRRGRGRGGGRRPTLRARADLVVDGIVGIGGRGGLRPDAALPVRAAAARPDAAVVAVDLPSGVDADSGEVRGDAVRADRDGHLRRRTSRGC